MNGDPIPSGAAWPRTGRYQARTATSIVTVRFPCSSALAKARQRTTAEGRATVELQVVDTEQPKDADEQFVDADSEVMFFASDAAGTLDLYEARRTMVGAPWDEVRRLTEVSGPSDDSNPQLLAGGRFIIFDSDRPGNGARDLYIASRASLNERFDPPVPLEELDTEMDERDAWLSEDGKTIYFSSNASGNFEIVVARR